MGAANTIRLKEPCEDWDGDPLATIKYMGSKRALVPIIAAEIAGLCAPGERVADLFAGTHSVGYALRNRNRIVGVDAQRYSRVIGRALLCDRLAKDAPAVLARLAPHLADHMDATAEIYGRALSRERSLLAGLDDERIDLAGIERYARFQVSLPDPCSFSEPARGRPRALDVRLRKLISQRRRDPTLFPYLLLSAYYANAYFGLEQAITLDGLRYAIDREFPPSGAGRDICLAALLCAASHCTSTPGHFAMWRLTRTQTGAADIRQYRAREPLRYFSEKLASLLAAQGTTLTGHDAVHADALNFVRGFDGDLSAAYLDPPYSAVHYSRFYHVLEELVDYDYPDVFHGGRFPTDRYSSSWSVRSSASEAFAELLDALADRGWPAVISYGSNGLVSEARLIGICQAAYGNAGTELRHLSARHASMGRSDRGSRSTRELLVTCRPRRRVRAAAAGRYPARVRPRAVSR